MSVTIIILFRVRQGCRSQWPRGLRRKSAATRLLRLWFRMPAGAWMPVCCQCCVLTGRGLCDELITHPEESYRVWCVVVCDLENLVNVEALTGRLGAAATNKKKAICTSTPVYEVTNSKRPVSLTRAQRTSNFESIKCKFTTTYTQRCLGLCTG